jgi:Ca2+-binding EF-hand superfamily protein
MCIIGLVAYMILQLKFNDAGQIKDKRIAIAKKTLQEGKMSLKGVVKSTIKTMESKRSLGSVSNGTGYGAIPSDSAPSPEILSELKELLHDAFCAYDSDNNGMLEKSEIRVFLKDFHENIDEDTINTICARVDKDNDNLVSLDGFVTLCYYLIMSDDDHSIRNAPVDKSFRASIHAHVFKEDDDEGDDDEVEDIPEEFTDLSPEDQQAAIKLRAFKMLFIGTLMVVYFSDPMVDVMQEIAVKCSLPPFYVSFILAPLASNSSEVIASMFYAAKKTRKTMTVSLSALEGAACMNNTFW